MPITAALVAVAAHALTDLDWTESFLLGALLSPTDPVLSSAVVTNPRVPRRIRHSLNLESGLNDGLALPAVLALLFSLDPDEGDFTWWAFVVQDLAVGLAAGAAGGLRRGAADARAARARHGDQPAPEVAVRARRGVRGLWRGRAAPRGQRPDRRLRVRDRAGHPAARHPRGVRAPRPRTSSRWSSSASSSCSARSSPRTGSSTRGSRPSGSSRSRSSSRARWRCMSSRGRDIDTGGRALVHVVVRPEGRGDDDLRPVRARSGDRERRTTSSTSPR